jgi:hypothetical protein
VVQGVRYPEIGPLEALNKISSVHKLVPMRTKVAKMHAATRPRWLEYLEAGDRKTSIIRKLT